ncbi:MAG: tetratricopeptide repeat protein [Idiomarina sp.]|nr:tetratricopeptide repeat protein [Idiomarina sp.]
MAGATHERDGVGKYCLCRGNFAQAESHYRTAIAIDSSQAVAFYNLAFALLRQGQYEAAIAAAAQAQELAPDHPRYGQAVETLEQAGRTNAAS